jgi:hypothetical protein
MDFIVHNAAGQIIRHGTCHPNDLKLQEQAGETALATTYQPGTVVNGVLVPLSAEEVEAQRKADWKSRIAARLAAQKAVAKA